METPKTLMEAAAYFSDEAKAHAFVVGMRWPQGVCCPRCGSVKVQCISTRRVWKCKDCTERKQFSVKVGTIFEDSPIPLGKWMVAVWMVVNAKNGCSSYEVARALGVTQKSAWFMTQRIRLAMKVGSFDRKLVGTIEADESGIGGRSINMHKKVRERRNIRNGYGSKALVQAVLERGGEIRTRVIPNTNGDTLRQIVHDHVAPGSVIFTDSAAGYRRLRHEYVHAFVNHAIRYVQGSVHTNGLENFWSLLKRGLTGTYVAVEPFHLERYVDEQAFRYNHRKDTDCERFLRVVKGAPGKRLTYDSLTGKEDADTEDCSS